MRKLLYLAALSMVATLLLASAAMAQGVPGVAGSTNPYGCPDEAPFVATVGGDPGEGSLLCFPTQAQADYYNATGDPSGGVEEPTTTIEETITEGQYVAPETPEPTTPTPTTTAAPLPATGGPALLLLPAAGLLVAAGLVALTTVRRRP